MIVPGLTALGLAAFGVPVGAVILATPAQAACAVNTATQPDTLNCVEDTDGVSFAGADDVIVNIGTGPVGGFTISNGIGVSVEDTISGDPAITYASDVDFFVNSSKNRPVLILNGDEEFYGNGHAVSISAQSGRVTFESDQYSTLRATEHYVDGGEEEGYWVSGAALSIDTVSGDIVVTNKSEMESDDRGIQLYSNSGSIEVDNKGDITAEYEAILASTRSGSVDIKNSASIFGEFGIVATTGYADDDYDTDLPEATTGGDIKINNSGIIRTYFENDEEDYRDGIVAGSVGGTIRIKNSGIIDAAGDGIEAHAVGAYNWDSEDSEADFIAAGDIVIDHSGAIISAGDDGIYADAYVDNGYYTVNGGFNANQLKVNTEYGSTIDAYDDGVDIETWDEGKVKLDLAGVIWAGDNGVEVYAERGNVSITTRGGYTDDETTYQGGQIIAQGDGINIEGGQHVELDIGEMILAGDNALDVYGANRIDATIGYGKVIAGGANGNFGTATISLAAERSIELTNNGIILATDGFNLNDGSLSSLSNVNPTALAIALEGARNKVDENGLQILNKGVIVGRLESESDDTSLTFDNISAGSFGDIESLGLWVFGGDSYFGGDSDVVNNGSRSGSAGIIVNASNGSESEWASFSNLEQFNNFGAVILRDQSVGDEQLFADTVRFDGNYYGSNSVENGFVLDVDLRGPSGITTLGYDGPSYADRVIIGGNFSGTSLLSLNDISGNIVNGLISEDIPLVQIVGESNGQFILSNGPIEKGLYTYDLFERTNGVPTMGITTFDEGEYSTEWVLAGYVDESVYNLASLASIAANGWHAQAEGWLNRSGDLRTYFSGSDTVLGYAPVVTPNGIQSQDTGIWGNVSGLKGSRTQQYTVGVVQDDVVLDAGYDETLFAAQAGFDHAFHTEAGTLVLGVMGVYGSNDITFNDGDTATISGPGVGVYADWINGNTYVSAMARADFLTAEYGINGITGETNGTSIGGVIEAGHKVDLNGMYVEPVASVSYVSTQFDQFEYAEDAYVDSVGLDGQSLRGKAGARFGGTILTEAAIISPYVSAMVGNEFLGESSASISTDGASRTVDFTGVYGELGAGVNFEAPGTGFTGFAGGTYTRSENYESGSLKGGLRANF